MRPLIAKLIGEVGDDSPWYEKALFHAVKGLEGEDATRRALDSIERQLAFRDAPTGRDRAAEPDTPA